MKKPHLLTAASCLYLFGFAQAETIVDSDRVIQGNLEVQADPNQTGTGDFLTDGVTRLAQGVVDMPNSRTDLGLVRAEYSGPYQLGQRSYKVSYTFEKNGSEMVGLPILYGGNASNIKVSATITRKGSNYETATWELSGSRHETVKCLRHTAYGSAEHFSIRGFMSHTNARLWLDYKPNLNNTDNHIITVIVEADLSRPWVAFGNDGIRFDDVAGGNLELVQPLEMIESTVYLKKWESTNNQLGALLSATKDWTGTHFNLNGEVSVNGLPLFTESQANDLYIKPGDTPNLQGLGIRQDVFIGKSTENYQSNFILGGANANSLNRSNLVSITGSNNDIDQTSRTSIVGQSNYLRSTNNSQSIGNSNNLSFLSNSISVGVSNLMGNENTSERMHSMAAIGSNLINRTSNSTVVGQYNEPLENTLFSVGDGTGSSPADRSNALVVYDDGSIDLNGPVSIESLEVGGQSLLTETQANGLYVKPGDTASLEGLNIRDDFFVGESSGNFGTNSQLGENFLNKSRYVSTIGTSNGVTETYRTNIVGFSNSVGSVINTQIIGQDNYVRLLKDSLVVGWENQVGSPGNSELGHNMAAIGSNLINRVPNSTVIGQYNRSHEDALFTVGNGTSGNPDAAPNFFSTAYTRSNALVVYEDGSVETGGDATINGLTFGRGGGNIETNVASGGAALLNNTTGSGNVVSGSNAFVNNSTGSNNIVIGHNAAGVDEQTLQSLRTVSNSIYIGANTFGFSNDDDNAIVIGTGSVGKGANTTVIGNTNTTETHLYGETNLESLRVSEQVILETVQGDISMGIFGQ